MTSENESLLLSTSAIGYYGFRKDEELTEDSRPGDDFLARLCIDWEKEALEARTKGVRVVVTRFGIVLGRNGGALQQMIPAFRRFVGGLWQAASSGSPGFICKIFSIPSSFWWITPTFADR